VATVRHIYHERGSSHLKEAAYPYGQSFFEAVLEVRQNAAQLGCGVSMLLFDG
jgi:hypothetical protein